MKASTARERIEHNLRTLSRTLMYGTVSAASTPGKAEIVISTGVSADETQHVTETNTVAALDLVETILASPKTPLDLRAVTEHVNTIFTRGILKGIHLYRTRDPARDFPYLPADAVHSYARSFYQVAERSTASAVEFAAYAIWAIDLRGHLFTDGCGKTATVISGLVLSRNGQNIPLYGSRNEYYAAPYNRYGIMSWRTWLGYFISRVNLCHVSG